MLKFNTLREVEEFALSESQGPMAYGETALLNNGLQVIRGKDGFYYLDLSYEQNQALEEAKLTPKKSAWDIAKEEEELERAERKAKYAAFDAEWVVFCAESRVSDALINHIERQHGAVTGVTVLSSVTAIFKSRCKKTYTFQRITDEIAAAKESVKSNSKCKIHQHAMEAIEWCENM
jgi:hypothetical protein